MHQHQSTRFEVYDYPQWESRFARRRVLALLPQPGEKLLHFLISRGELDLPFPQLLSFSFRDSGLLDVMCGKYTSHSIVF